MQKIIPFKNIRVSDNLDSVMSQTSGTTGIVVAVMCKAGRLRIELGRQESYEMAEHDLLLCTSDFLSKQYLYTPDFQCLIFSIPHDTLTDVVYSCLRVETNWYDKLQFLKQHPIIHMNERQIQLYEAYEQLIDLHIQESGPYSDRISDALAQAIIFEILYMLDLNIRRRIGMGELIVMNNGMLSTNSNKSRLNQLFYRFVQLLENNHTSRRSVSWYAEEMAITPKYLTYICRQVTGKTPTDIINSIAIREIKQILLNTNDTVKEIAYNMNYASASSFCKYFRLQTGISPQAFRRQSRHTLQ